MEHETSGMLDLCFHDLLSTSSVPNSLKRKSFHRLSGLPYVGNK